MESSTALSTGDDKWRNESCPQTYHIEVKDIKPGWDILQLFFVIVLHEIDNLCETSFVDAGHVDHNIFGIFRSVHDEGGDGGETFSHFEFLAVTAPELDDLVLFFCHDASEGETVFVGSSLCWV